MRRGEMTRCRLVETNGGLLLRRIVTGIPIGLLSLPIAIVRHAIPRVIVGIRGLRRLLTGEFVSAIESA